MAEVPQESNAVELRLIGPPELVEPVLEVIKGALRTGTLKRRPSRYGNGDVLVYGTVEPQLAPDAEEER